MTRRAAVPFDVVCRAWGLPVPVAEYQFDMRMPDTTATPKIPRKWKFDWAWPSFNGRHIALEVEGGIFIAGRHSRGGGMLGDMEKYNEAAAQGWLVFRVTPRQLDSPETLALLRRVLR